jgi:uncharacterized protein (TIGR03546 family)
MIELIAKTLKVLNSETDPAQISLAFCLAMVMALTPLFSAHNVLVLLAAFVLRVNLSTFSVVWIVLSAVAYALDPLFHKIGLAALTAEGLKSMWTGLYNTAWFRPAHLNNTIVMGSLLVSLAAFIPVFIIIKVLVLKYREHLLAWVNRTRVMKFFKASKLYEVYQTISGFGGAS